MKGCVYTQGLILLHIFTGNKPGYEARVYMDRLSYVKSDYEFSFPDQANQQDMNKPLTTSE